MLCVTMLSTVCMLHDAVSTGAFSSSPSWSYVCLKCLFYPVTFTFSSNRESLGRFPEMAVREHFLEQMRTYMVGGAAVMSAQDSPHRLGQQHSIDSSNSSLDESRDRLRHQQMQQHQLPTQQQQQQVCYLVGRFVILIKL